MTRDEVEARVHEVLSLVLRVPALPGEPLLRAAVPEWDSLAHVEIIYAVEDGTIPLKRVENALARNRRAKERFLAPPRPLPLQGAALRTLLGRNEHAAIAAEMARFA